MIRIDEIYNHTFWPWIRDNRPGTRLFFCDPFGHTDPEHLYNYGSDHIHEHSFVFMHDQEPIQLKAHSNLFTEVKLRNRFDPTTNCLSGKIIVSEKGEECDKLTEHYGWSSAYYFFHGWACLDWYRGYDRTFLIPPIADRIMPTKTFMSPNRIIGGQRDHRILFIYHCIRRNIRHNYISAPGVCPVENIAAVEVANKYSNIYPDIMQVIQQADLPWLFSGEQTQQMTSCWLGNFAEAMDSLIYVPTETVYFGRRLHITEKTFKAIALGMPFVLVATADSLEYMRSYGFKTFSSIWNEDYDQERDDIKRLEMVTDLLAEINGASIEDKRQIWRHCKPIVEHNWNHFYKGAFESILWHELNGMLNGL